MATNSVQNSGNARPAVQKYLTAKKRLNGTITQHIFATNKNKNKTKTEMIFQ